MSDETPAATLEKIFHEPNRLAIMSALCAAESGLSFPELRETCSLTDGNLNRHLKVLSGSSAIVIKKQFINDRPRTTVSLSPTGLARFQDYLKALEAVLLNARTALETTAQAADETEMVPGAIGATA
ncbi:MAG: helix-turn-helix domain-containing protein [Verrucomicrobia bacterium]|jgi:DNA-binding transcriptional ArsR family regulator|nr:helix-turn-helix domain-containing protein [Verrucomicrobiota bacterium]